MNRQPKYDSHDVTCLTSITKYFQTIAKLSNIALSEDFDLQVFMENSLDMLVTSLNIDFAKIDEVQSPGLPLLLRAGYGWSEHVRAGHSFIGAGLNTQSGYTLLSTQPVIVTNLRAEKRFPGSSLLHDHGIVSGVSTIIPGDHMPYGVLSIHTKTLRRFAPDEIRFIQNVADIISIAVARTKDNWDVERSDSVVGS